MVSESGTVIIRGRKIKNVVTKNTWYTLKMLLIYFKILKWVHHYILKRELFEKNKVKLRNGEEGFETFTAINHGVT